MVCQRIECILKQVIEEAERVGGTEKWGELGTGSSGLSQRLL